MSSTVENLNPGIFIENLTKPSIEIEEGNEVNMASTEPEWASQIIKYLKDGGYPRTGMRQEKWRWRQVDIFSSMTPSTKEALLSPY